MADYSRMRAAIRDINTSSEGELAIPCPDPACGGRLVHDGERVVCETCGDRD